MADTHDIEALVANLNYCLLTVACKPSVWAPFMEEAITALERQQALWDGLFEAIKHGDDEHQEWLDEAIKNVRAGLPVPPPRGTGNKEKMQAVVEAAQRYTELYEAAERDPEKGKVSWGQVMGSVVDIRREVKTLARRGVVAVLEGAKG